MDRQRSSEQGWGNNLSLVFKMVGAILFVFTSSLTLVAVLSFLKFDRVYLDAYSLRYDSVTLEAKGVIESSLGRGLTLESNTAGSVAIARLAEQHGGDFALTLHSIDGTLVAATSDDHSVDIAPVVQPILKDPAALVRSTTTTSFTTSAAIQSEGDTLGVVTVEFSSAPINADLTTLRTRMRLAAIGTFLVFAPVFFVFVFVAIFPRARLFAKEAAGMRQIADSNNDVTANSALLMGAARIQADLDAAESVK